MILTTLVFLLLIVHSDAFQTTSVTACPKTKQQWHSLPSNNINVLSLSTTATASSENNNYVNRDTNSLINNLIGEENKSLLRATEISSVVLLDVLAPIIQSLIYNAGDGLSKDARTGKIDWDKFWSLSTTTASSTGRSTMTNAKRLSIALETLGPTYVKFGQALGSRPDIVPSSLCDALSSLQDNMKPFSTIMAKETIRNELLSKLGSNSTIVSELINNIPDNEPPIAAASIGQVYKSYLPDYGYVAVKVQRPGIYDIVKRDATLLRNIATFLESIPALPSVGGEKGDNDDSSSGNRLIQTELVNAVDEFMSRIFEELDYLNEAKNALMFSELYCSRRKLREQEQSEKWWSWRRKRRRQQQKQQQQLKKQRNNDNIINYNMQVIVPEILLDYCTQNVLVMEWIDGSKLTSVVSPQQRQQQPSSENSNNIEDEQSILTKKENIRLIDNAIECTLSQLLVTGILHADPHSGNLLKVDLQNNDSDKHRHNRKQPKEYALGYLDFGLISTINTSVRDGLVCAVTQLIFAKDVDAVASLFGELDLLPLEVLEDEDERNALADALQITMAEALTYPTTSPNNQGGEEDTQIPNLRFDKLLDALARLIPRFQFQLPPYFINNARALSTLEGIAKGLEPSFNVLQTLYPFALNRLLTNPTKSPVVEKTVNSLINDMISGRVDLKRARKLLSDSALITGYSNRRVLRDILKTSGGRKIAKRIVREELHIFRARNDRRNRRLRMEKQQQQQNTNESNRDDNSYYYLKKQ